MTYEPTISKISMSLEQVCLFSNSDPIIEAITKLLKQIMKSHCNPFLAFV